MAIDWNKPLQTRDGRPAEMVKDYGKKKPNKPKLITIFSRDGTAVTSTYFVLKSGRYTMGRESELDIINVPDLPRVQETHPILSRIVNPKLSGFNYRGPAHDIREAATEEEAAAILSLYRDRVIDPIMSIQNHIIRLGTRNPGTVWERLMKEVLNHG